MDNVSRFVARWAMIWGALGIFLTTTGISVPQWLLDLTGQETIDIVSQSVLTIVGSAMTLINLFKGIFATTQQKDAFEELSANDTPNWRIGANPFGLPKAA